MSYSDWTLSYKKALAAFPKLPSSAIRYLPLAICLLAFLGFLDATYLTILHYKNAIPPCTLHGCETVLSSSYATIFGIPIALIGGLFYLSVLGLLGLWLQMKKASLLSLLSLLTLLALFVAIGLVYIQVFILHAFCQYCLASELIDFLLFDCAWWLWRKAQ